MRPPMSDDTDNQSKKTPAQTMAELVARRRAALGDGGPAGANGGGRRQAERAAAARSASKSKPALRK